MVAVVRPRFAPDARRAGLQRREYDGLPIAEAVVPVPRGRLPRLLARNVAGPRLLRKLVHAEAKRLDADLIHAQHALTVPAAVAAAAGLRRRVAVVATVRDYWPLAYYSTMQVPRPLPANARDGVPADVPVADGGRTVALVAALWRAEGPRALARLPIVPVWQLVTARRRAALRRADATIAVSQFVGSALLRRGAVRPERLHVVPNLVDLPRVATILETPAPLAAVALEPGAPFLLFVGKLEPSK
ncbi:MAG TPA: glycosyltransferase, partial [Chloroflexia bacterium]|nr:glycosyltransferase [Chloroflexia bacterium]